MSQANPRHRPSETSFQASRENRKRITDMKLVSHREILTINFQKSKFTENLQL